MASLCFVLSKSSPSYTYIGVHEVTASAILSDLTQAAQKIASVSHGWEPTNVKIELYEPTAALGIRDKSRKDRTKRVLATVNDEYLRTECDRVVFGWKPHPECLIAVATFSIDFVAFERIGKDEHFTYVTEGKVAGSPGNIVQLVRNTVEATAEELPGIEERLVLAVNVYETEHPRKVLKDELRRSESREFGVLLTVAGGENVVPRGDTCLFVELRTCAYIQFKYALFREDTSQDFTFVGVGIAKGLSSDTLKVVEAAAREFIESLKNWDASTMSAYISIYEPKSKSHHKSPLESVGAQLTAENLVKDLVRYSTNTELDQIAQSLVVVFAIETPMHPLEPIHEDYTMG